MVAADALRPVAPHRRTTASRAPSTSACAPASAATGSSLGALKIFTDGGMMARTAALPSPTTARPAAGSSRTPAEHSTDTIVDGHLAGWQLAVHAIGDRAVDVALDALEQAQRLHRRPERPAPDRTRRSRPPDQLARFAALGVTAVVQPNFLRYFGDDYAAIMGE